MLTKPNALAKAGVGTGLIVVVITGFTGFWTMILMMSMYFDRKRDLVSGWQCNAASPLGLVPLEPSVCMPCVPA